MKRGLRGAGVAAVCLAAVALTAGATGAKPKPKPKRPPKPPLPAIRLNAKDPNALVLTAPGYRLTLSKENGQIVDVLDRRTGVHVVRGQNGCLWAAKQTTGEAASGCSFGRTGADLLSFGWSQPNSTLTLRYDGKRGDVGVDATATIVARTTAFDLRLSVATDLEYPLSAVLFPADLLGNATRVDAGYMPTFLPGIRFLKGFFTEPHRNVETYPSRWAFADFLAADMGPSHIAVYTVNPSPSPVAPVDIGFVRNASPAPCSEGTFCATHVFQTWIARGREWQSPVVRIRVGGTIDDSLDAYRQDNGIDRYPSLADKVGPRLERLVRAPLVKADMWKGLPAFSDWAPYLRRLPRPALVHPVAFQKGGFDESYPDFLPPDPLWGSPNELNGVFEDVRSLGGLAMPYLNVSWWDTQAPSVHELPASLEPKDIAMQTVRGTPVTEQFGDKDGYIVSPHVPAVRTRIEGVLEEWRTQVDADCLFFDQLGARPWRRDFNPASPTPLAYYDGWLSLFAGHPGRCFMAEDGWDRLAESFAGFHGGVLQMSRQFEWPDRRWGPGNWEPYPIAGRLFQDKVLMYQHDLYEETMAGDPEVLTFNVAFGLVMSFNWDGDTGSIESPWLTLAGQLQRTLGPYYAGRRITSFERVAEGVTKTVFEGGYSALANWSSKAVEVDGRPIAPSGFVAQAPDGSVLAATYGGAWSAVSFPTGAR